jgi:DNA-binding FrmR family transcriptional regulator
MNQLMGGEAPKSTEEKNQRKLADSTLGWVTRHGGINQIRGSLDPKNPMTPLAYQVHAVQTALQAEMSRLLSMGMTGQIAHAHAKELAQAVGELDELPSADAVVKQVKAIKGIIGAIQVLPMIPTDPIEAQKMISTAGQKLNEGSAQPKMAPGEVFKSLTGRDGQTHHYLKRIKPDGTGTEWIQTH